MKRFLLSVTVLLSGFVGFAQQNACGTDEHYKQTATENAALAEQRAQFNKAFMEAMKTYNPNDYKVQKGLGKASPPKYIIPVVVHVFHQNGSENISDAQIKSEIAQLNKSFSRTNSDTGNVRPFFKDIAADAQIEFRLAKKDPQGNCTNGIVRVYSPMTMKANDELKKTSVWDTKRYYNMWVVNSINRGPGVGVAGYAQFPFFAGGASSASTDGIMVIHNEFGNIGTSSPGQTLNVTTSTHESGHWLGLYHPFQGDSCDNEGDGIAETPTTYFVASTTEPLRNRCNIPNYNSCATDNPDLPDQYENFMDYFIGTCASNMFTLQQVARMHFCLENYRRDLWQPANLEATGTADGYTCINLPIASFNMSAPGKIVCVGANVSFRDNSYNAPVTSWDWNFGENATPATSTSQNPVNITYSTPGWKTITLTSTGTTGSGTTVMTNYIYVQATSEFSGISGGAANADWDYANTFQADGWYFENESNDVWTRTPTTHINGNMSLMLQSRNLTYGFTYSLISPTFNLSGATNPYISYSYSFAANYLGTANTNDSRDGLQLSVSYDCGKTWSQRKNTVGSTAFPNGAAIPNPLTTGGGPVQPSVYYTPSNLSQWKSDGITGTNVGNATQLASVKFKLSFTYQGGNNFYLDALMVGLSSGIADVTAKDVNFNIVPNPFNTTADINYELKETNTVEIKLYDIVGKEVATLQTGKQESGTHQVTINRSDLGLQSGMYFVKTAIGNSSFSTKVLIN
ncbi:MAG: M43 family zinc metalloprotease [Bacteroidota bacterium]